MLISGSPQPALAENPSWATLIAQRADAPVIIDDRLVELYLRNTLRSNPMMDGSNIQVTVKLGVVTLEGNVDCEEVVELAEKIARETRGAREVVNKLRSGGHRCILEYRGYTGRSGR